MDRAGQLIERARLHRIRKLDLSVALGIDRSTLWKYEQSPEVAPEGFWPRYDEAISRIKQERDRNESAAVVAA